MISLRPYQQEAVDAVFAYWQRGGGNPIVEIPTGSGKSLVCAEVACQVARGGSRVVIATHRKELIQQDADAVRKLWPDAPLGIWSASVGQRRVDAITVCGVQTAVRDVDRLGNVGVVIVDECFVGETMVSTPTGAKRIDNVRTGDKVLCATGIGTVLAVSVKPSVDLVEVKFDDGTTTICTASHKFFTGRGWAEASSMEIDEIVFGKEAVRSLWRDFLPAQVVKKRRNGCLHVGTGVERASVLLAILREEAKESDDGSARCASHEGITKKDRAQADQERRQRAIAAVGAIGSIARVRGWVGIGASNPNENASRERLSDLLQARYCEHGKKDRNRVGRVFSRRNLSPRTRRKENIALGIARVVSVSRVKSKSARPVFNLHVDGHPSYYANGHLAHNCHLVSPSGGTMYHVLLDRLRVTNPELRVMGLSATPYRLGQGVLTWGEDRIFDAVVYRAHMRDLVRDGYLSPLVTGKAHAEINVFGIGKSGGDFVLRDLELAANIDEITQTVASDLAASGRQHILVFGVSIAHAMALRDALLFAGIECEVVSGETDKARRADILARFKAGTLRAIASCDILTTGFDAPCVDAVAVVRATCSPGLWVQMAGRGSRLAPGKQDCMIFDYGGNIARHGPVDDVAPPKTRGPKKGDKAPIKSCPSCFAEVHAAARVCDHCDYEFPAPEKKANHNASALPVMSTGEKEAPRVVQIERTAYARNKGKDGKPDTLRVEYFERATDVRAVCCEWVCLDHDDGSWPQRKAAQWWWARCKGDTPASVAGALERSAELPITTEITIVKDGKFNRVLSAKWRERTDADNAATDSGFTDDAPLAVDAEVDAIDLW